MNDGKYARRDPSGPVPYFQLDAEYIGVRQEGRELFQYDRPALLEHMPRRLSLTGTVAFFFLVGKSFV